MSAFRVLDTRTFAVAWLFDRTGDWLALVFLLTAAAEFSLENASAVAWTLALWFVPRMVIGVLYASLGARLGDRGWPALAVAKAMVVVLTFAAIFTRVAPGVLEFVLGTAAVLGFAAALSAEARAAALKRHFPIDRLGQASAATSFVDRAAVLLGEIVAAVISYVAPVAIAFGVAFLAFLASAAISYQLLRRSLPSGSRPAVSDRAPVETSDPRETARQTVVWIVAGFTSGAVGAALLVASFTFFAGTPPESIGGFPVAAFGLGLLLSPLPMSRLLLRFSAPVLLLALALVVAIVTIVIAAATSLPVALIALVVFGFAAGSMDALRSIALKRLVPGDLSPRIRRLSFLALGAGQLFGAVGVVSTAGQYPFVIAAIVAVAQVLLLALGVARAGRGALSVGSLSPLAVKSVVHKLSWDTRPAAKPADLSTADPRAQRLAKWINRTVALEQVTATLPISRREYTVFRPNEESRERLFEQGRADPEKQMPYWAKVWPSGVALADVVVERREEVAGRQILELGAGLGVTASAVLEYGGDLVTADYSALPLAHCRLTTLVNTGRVPEATCFNWRHDSEIRAVLARPEFAAGFPLIIGGDLLYEGRDAEPLLNVIERMLTSDGQLWLAEPVRKTAQRFLDSAVEHGWDIESRQVRAQWPDATDGPVNLHFLRRSREPDRMATDLGGWRI